MRIGLVSPYSWSFQGGVNRHVEALAEEFLGRGHDVRVLAPVDPPGLLSRATHRAAPEPRELPDYLVPLGRTIGFGANGSISNLAATPGSGYVRPRHEVRAGEFDVIHVHEPTGAADRLERRARRQDAGGRHLPRLLDQAGAQLHRHRARRPSHAEPPLGADRRLRGGRLDGDALVRRRVHDHPQRRRHRGAAGRAEDRRGRSCGSSSSAGPRSARGCRSC